MLRDETELFFQTTLRNPQISEVSLILPRLFPAQARTSLATYKIGRHKT